MASIYTLHCPRACEPSGIRTRGSPCVPSINKSTAKNGIVIVIKAQYGSYCSAELLRRAARNDENEKVNRSERKKERKKEAEGGGEGERVRGRGKREREGGSITKKNRRKESKR